MPYWSATVLKTKAMGLPAGSRGSSDSLPSSSTTMAGLPSRGEGANFFRFSMRRRVPRPFMEQPQKTGVMVRCRMPSLMPLSSSSGVKGSSMKNFSMRASSVSATCSLSSIIYSSIRSAASAGMGISLPSTP